MYTDGIQTQIIMDSATIVINQGANMTLSMQNGIYTTAATTNSLVNMGYIASIPDANDFYETLLRVPLINSGTNVFLSYL